LLTPGEICLTPKQSGRTATPASFTLDLFSLLKISATLSTLQLDTVDMKTQIVHISKLQTSKVMAVLYLVISIPMVLMMFLPMLFTHQPIQWSIIWWMPLLYAVIGFVFTFLGAWIYNGVAGWMGGIEFTISDRPVD
jgi:hypothetical protein